MIKNIFIEIDCQLIEIWYLQNISVLSVNIRLHKSAISRHIKSLFMNMKSFITAIFFLRGIEWLKIVPIPLALI